MDSKVSTLIIDRGKYKVLKLTLPFLSQVIAVITVAHKDVAAVRKERICIVIGLNGKKKSITKKLWGIYVPLE